MSIHFFPNQTDFRKWLEANHQKASELLVGYYKVKSGMMFMPPNSNSTFISFLMTIDY
jgi:uncharacterized protein YdeI (YjbR/CyaY-like superfamily)